VRGDDGYWYHPDIPEFDEDAEAWKHGSKLRA
jgi:hypothetical protein